MPCQCADRANANQRSRHPYQIFCLRNTRLSLIFRARMHFASSGRSLTVCSVIVNAFRRLLEW